MANKTSRFLKRKHVTELIHAWRHALGLSDWQIAETYDIPEDDGELCLMSVHRHSLYKDAVLYVHPWCIGKGSLPEDTIEERFASRSFFEYKIIHELLHLVIRDLVMHSDKLDGYLHRDALEVYEASQKVLEEQFVDNLARSLQYTFGRFRDTE